MNSLRDVKDETLRTAAADSGYTTSPDDRDVRLYIWVYVPSQETEAIRATWENVLTNVTTWIQDPSCAIRP